MTGLKCSKEEALEIYEYDKKVDKAKVKDRLEYDLDLETEKAIKKLVNVTDRKKAPNYQFSKRERKENTTKSGLINEIAVFLTNKTENVTIVNKERVISFTVGDDVYEVTLTQKRKPK